MEVILSTVFGRAVDVQNGKGGELYENAKAVFSGVTEGGAYLRMLGMLSCMFYSCMCSSVNNIINSGKLKCTYFNGCLFNIVGFPFLRPILVHLAKRTKLNRAMNFVTKASAEMIEKRRKQGDSVSCRHRVKALLYIRIS